MPNDHFYRQLVSKPAPYKRTDSDYAYVIHGDRARRSYDYSISGIVPGMQKPSLVSSFQGSIERILFCFPAWAVKNPAYSNAYKSVISALRRGTNFIVVHHKSTRSIIERWFIDLGHDESAVSYVSVNDYVSLTDWAEDAYVGAVDAIGGARYLLEPWSFLRGGDALIADAVEDQTDIRASQCPLMFQGGNCLIGDNFWLLGRDYFHDSVKLLKEGGAPVDTRGKTEQETASLTAKLFSDYLDAERQLILVGSSKPIPVQRYAGSKEAGSFFLDIVDGGVGTFQPIFHIDMFLTPVGRNSSGAFTVLVGSPSLGEKLSGEKSPQPLDHAYNDIAVELDAAGFDVIRNPLVHKGAETGDVVTLDNLKVMSKKPGGEVMLNAIRQLEGEGAVDGSPVKVRDYHHITWNNCLVENSAGSKHVYLPTFGHGSNQHLSAIDKYMKEEVWQKKLNFTVHMLGDFNPFAERQGVVHCIKKYISRGL